MIYSGLRDFASSAADSRGAIVEEVYSQTHPAIVQGMLLRDSASAEALYPLVSKAVRRVASPSLGTNDLGDHTHNCYLLIEHQISSVSLRYPERLWAFIVTCARRYVYASINRRIHDRNLCEGLRRDNTGLRPVNPTELGIAHNQQKTLARRVLSELAPREREVLERFYLSEEQAERICDVMDMTPTQFRLLKSRAKARFGVLGRRLLNGSALPSTFPRNQVNLAPSRARVL